MLADFFKNLPLRLPRRIPTNIIGYLQEKLKDKRYRYGAIGIVVILILLSIFFKKDNTTMFTQTVLHFISATVEYQPEEAKKYTVNMSRDMISIQTGKIAKAKQAGFKTTLDEPPAVRLRTTGSTEMVADVTVRTTEYWPGKNPEKFTHRFLMRGQKTSEGWRISEIMQMPSE